MSGAPSGVRSAPEERLHRRRLYRFSRNAEPPLFEDRLSHVPLNNTRRPITGLQYALIVTTRWSWSYWLREAR